MLQKLQNHIETNLNFLHGKKILLAVSGGIDSMVLMDLFHKLKYSIAIAHCNFNLRGDDSLADEQFVKQKAVQLQIPTFTMSFETATFAKSNKLSTQQAARKLRYDWFYEILLSEKLDYIITAHHLDDSLETFLINFSRGTGIDGLTGIPFLNDRIVRPLLIFSRHEIEQYAQENELKWREDASNASNKYLRNSLRHEVIPILKKIQPQLLNNFQKTLYYLKQTQQYIFDVTQKEFQEVVTRQSNELRINIKKLLQLPNYKGSLYFWLNEYEFSAWEDIYDLVYAQAGKQIFSPNYVLLKDRDFLILHKKEVQDTQEYSINEDKNTLHLPIKMSLKKTDAIFPTNKESIFIDEDKVSYPLVMRRFNEGDYFHPFGMKGTKKVSKYFKDKKMSLLEKTYIWLLCSNDKIIWIINHRMDERFKVTDTTKNILEITYYP